MDQNRSERHKHIRQVLTELCCSFGIADPPGTSSHNVCTLYKDRLPFRISTAQDPNVNKDRVAS